MPKVVDHETYRRELLRASFDVVARVGYGSLSMKQLARSIGVSTGSIYNYFESKEDWFVSLVLYFSKETFDRLRQNIPPDASLLEKTERLADEIEAHRDDYANMIRIASDFVRMPAFETQDGRRQLGFALDSLYERIATLFETDEATARALVSYVGGAILSGRLDPRGLDGRECLPIIRKLLDISETATTGDLQ